MHGGETMHSSANIKEQNLNLVTIIWHSARSNNFNNPSWNPFLHTSCKSLPLRSDAKIAIMMQCATIKSKYAYGTPICDFIESVLCCHGWALPRHSKFVAVIQWQATLFILNVYIPASQEHLISKRYAYGKHWGYLTGSLFKCMMQSCTISL